MVIIDFLIVFAIFAAWFAAALLIGSLIGKLLAASRPVDPRIEQADRWHKEIA